MTKCKRSPYALESVRVLTLVVGAPGGFDTHTDSRIVGVPAVQVEVLKPVQPQVRS